MISKTQLWNINNTFNIGAYKLISQCLVFMRNKGSSEIEYELV